jgi:prevent-host-death family protein
MWLQLHQRCSHNREVLEMSIGIRELRDTLSRQLDRVREGHTITVTDHGRPIARIVPIEGESLFERLVTEGKITPARSTKRHVPAPVDTGVTVSDLIAEQRG